MKRVLSVQDLSCVGKCSLTVAMPVLCAMGCSCTPLPTGILSSHTAFANPHVRDLTEDMDPICRHWQSIGAEFDAICVGYLAKDAQADAVSSLLDSFSSYVVLDPVMGDNGKFYSGISPRRIDTLRSLCKKTDVLLPNVTEAALLTNLPYRQTTDIRYYRQLAEGLRLLGCDTFLITGVCLSEGSVGFFGMDKGQEISYQAPSLSRHAHGTGDLFAAVFTGAKVNGKSVKDAAVTAADFVAKCLAATQTPTPFGINFEAQLPSLWEETEKNC